MQRRGRGGKKSRGQRGEKSSRLLIYYKKYHTPDKRWRKPVLF